MSSGGATDAAFISSAVVETVTGDAIEIRVVFAGELPLGLRLHSGQRDALVRRMMLASGAVSWSDRQCAFAPHQDEPARRFAERLRKALARLAEKPIGHRQVEKLLGITAAERRRWTKDSRLPASGVANVKRGPSITLATYSPQVIETLMKVPAIIALWRDADREGEVK